ncbi:MAG: ABC transporter permease [Nitrospinae bacterium]|nr:ABC transporter permease [Nitrospinota bacterium]
MSNCNRPAWVGGSIVALAVLVALLASVLAPHDPTAQQLARGLEPPGWEHPFGRDKLGRDIFSRVVYGTRISFAVGLTTVVVSACVGISIGLLSGYAGGVVDEVLMRVTDIFLAFPGILLAIALMAILGPSLRNVVIALCLMGWVGYARLVRGQVLALREYEFVLAARAIGACPGRIVFRHLLPNTLAPVIVEATFGLAGTIIAEAGLSFLGLGAQPPTPSWGSMLNEGRAFLLVAPHLTIFPGLAIMLLVLGFNFLGDGLRDALDPKRRGA